MFIAVDGPTASGKGTISKALAKHFALPHMDTGLLYRAVGRRVLDRGIDPQDARVAEAEARALTPKDLARSDLRGSLADMAASKVAAIPAVRAALLDFQRRFGATEGAVLDGRDIGTVVFPDARVKLFITASVAERARRRFLELAARGVAADPAQVEAEIRDRDAQDANRPVAPLKPAPDAIEIDTTALDADQAFNAALALIRKRLESA